MRRFNRLVWVIACLVMWVGPVSRVVAQAIDPSDTRARLGEPLVLDIRVRHGNASLGSLAPHCVQATLGLGNTLFEPEDLVVTIHPDLRPGWERVRLTHPSRVAEPVIDVHLQLRCGAEFSRSFAVLVDLEPARVAALSPVVARPSLRRPRERAVQPLTSESGATPAQVVPQLLPTTAPVLSWAAPAEAGLQPARAMVAALLDELQHMREEQRRAQSELASLQARLAHRERRWLGESWMPWAASLSAVPLLWALRWWAPWRGVRRSAWRQPARDAAFPLAPSSGAAGVSTVHGLSEAARSLPVEATLAATQPLERRTRWAHADFGEASLDHAPAPAFLRESERYVAEGYPVAAITLMERALQAQPGKNPWHLLMLLDLYSALRQERNQECVAAQLEALYNVQIPELKGLPIEGRGLLEQPASLARVAQAWQAGDRDEQLAVLLLQPVLVEPLDLAAFRDVLLLHAMARALNDEMQAPSQPFEPVIDWAPTALAV